MPGFITVRLLLLVCQRLYVDVLRVAMKNIPITVFTGFLGAGKTSIILSLLPRLPKDYKVVLLKNEFGDVEGAQVSLVFCQYL